MHLVAAELQCCAIFGGAVTPNSPVTAVDIKECLNIRLLHSQPFMGRIM